MPLVEKYLLNLLNRNKSTHFGFFEYFGIIGPIYTCIFLIRPLIYTLKRDQGDINMALTRDFKKSVLERHKKIPFLEMAY